MNTPATPTHTHSLNELRGHLMATLAGLRDKQHPMPVDTARAIAQVGSVLVDTARVEIEFLKATKGRTSAFMAPASLAQVAHSAEQMSDTAAPEQHASAGDTHTPTGPAAIQSVWRNLTEDERGVAR